MGLVGAVVGVLACYYDFDGVDGGVAGPGSWVLWLVLYTVWECMCGLGNKVECVL